MQGGQVPGVEGGGAEDDSVVHGRGGGAATQGEGDDSLAGQTHQSIVTEGVEDLPDQGQESESGRFPVPVEPDISGPVTRSRKKRMKPNY